jgi:hypothetical protein
MEDKERLARVIRRMAALVYPLPLKDAHVEVEAIDGKKFPLPVYLGEPLATKADAIDPNAKEKIYAAVPAKNEAVMDAKKILIKADLSVSTYNRDKLHELVTEKRVERTKGGYRKTT